ncbi:hypothetical protein BH11BAC2_BH11BAC2_15220 [soil metagenome]
MKRAVSIVLTGLLVFMIILCFTNSGKSEEDVSHCLVKYKSEWSQPCTQCTDYSKSYRVYFRNECMQKLDVMCAAQESDKRWKTFTRLDLAPNDTLTAYACKGSGKYMSWVRKAGDKTVVFPSEEEVNVQYGK